MIGERNDNDLSQVFDAVSVGIMILDKAGIIVKVNKALLRYFHIEQSDILGKAFGDAFLCKQGLDKGCGIGKNCQNCELRKSFEKVRDGWEERVFLEFSKSLLAEKVEKDYWFRVSLAQFVYQDKKHVAVTFTDITERKEKHDNLEKTKDFYFQMLDDFSSLIFRTDTSGNVTYVNKEWMFFTGVSREECLGQRWLDWVHPEDRQMYLDVKEKAFEERIPFTLEFRVRHRSGLYRWIKGVYSPSREIDGQLGYIGLGIDITDRKELENGLIRYRLLSEKVRDIILFVEKNGKIIDANNAAVNFYGYTRNELLNMTVFQLREDPDDFVLEQLGEAEQEGTFFECRHQKKDGSLVPVEVSSKGTMIGKERILLSIIRDVTDRKKTEDALKKAKEEAEIASQAKSEFLANMSHEIRTPLNGIVGMVDLLRLSKLTEEQKENIEIVKTCSSALLNVINDVLDFSKMEAGKMKIIKKGFNLEELVDHIIKAQIPTAEEKGLSLNVSFSVTVPRYVEGDPHRLQQVLNNLLSNAIKFTEKGEVWVAVNNTPSAPEMVSFTVKDTGMGIASSDLAKIFESFSQLDGSFTRRFGGTGLGLAISRQLVKLMGGSIEVVSVKNQGSRFQFTIPLKKGVVSQNPKIEERISDIVSASVLIVEDDAVNQLVISKMLRECGYRVTVAGNGFEAVEMVKADAFDAILMDIQMPEMDGMEATQRIRKFNKQIPIIAVTAHALEGDRERFLANGMDNYVSKPIKLENLIDAIEKSINIKVESDNIKNMGVIIGENGEIVIGQRIEPQMKSMDQDCFLALSAAIADLSVVVEEGRISLLEEMAGRVKRLANQMEIEELKTVAFKMELEARRGNYENAAQKLLKIEDIFNVLQKQFNIN
ncbi:PAS domain S-box protein [Eubacteriaceae bacterium ES3]|nr:PAS domain S-box protein [Eubacteriaceae bacterium ES3]